jgi:hypothetical protein
MDKGINNRFDSIISEHLAGYNNALNAQKNAEEWLVKARAEAKRCGYDHFLSLRLSDRSGSDKAKKELLKNAWRSLIEKTKLSVLMDTETKARMDADLETNPPVLSEVNIRSILHDLYNRRDEILAASLLNVIYGLSTRFKSNNKFKLTGKRIIVGLGVTPYNSSDKAGKLTDLDRILHYMGGRAFDAEKYDETLGYQATYSKEREIDSHYLRVVLHANGNAHVYFKEAANIEQCNKLIAYHNKNRLGKETGKGMFKAAA